MRVYHGSYIKIDKIDISKSKPNKDFGRGFYVTKFLIIVLLNSLSVCAQNNNNANTTSQGEAMKIKITIGRTTLTATIADNATARDFVSLLPLTLTLNDYNRIEKVSNFPRQLTTAGAPAGYDPSVGDITLYAPWGNLAIFYGDYGYAHGLIYLGRIDSGIETFAVSGSLIATFEVMP